ncbi:MAG: response regulator [Burkholderiaceae bacterium]|nr:response regulator [Burkholderiaceae bacterium]
MQNAFPQSTDATPATGPRIMVVEDNPDALYLAAEILRAIGYTVDTAASGELALRQLHAQPCDILFTDVSLPGMSGIELARTAIAHYPALRIIFATGYGAALTRGLGFAATTLRKPYDLEQLQAALAS